MSEVNYDWVRSQFQAAKVRTQSGLTVLELLKAWEKLDVPEDVATDALRIFAEVAQGHALVPESGGEVWRQAVVGQVRQGDTVRVKHDAFAGDQGVSRNGRVGKVVGIRSGDIIFKSTDGKRPEFEFEHFRFNQIEKRFK